MTNHMSVFVEASKKLQLCTYAASCISKYHPLLFKSPISLLNSQLWTPSSEDTITHFLTHISSLVFSGLYLYPLVLPRTYLKRAIWVKFDSRLTATYSHVLPFAEVFLHSLSLWVTFFNRLIRDVWFAIPYPSVPVDLGPLSNCVWMIVTSGCNRGSSDECICNCHYIWEPKSAFKGLQDPRAHFLRCHLQFWP